MHLSALLGIRNWFPDCPTIAASEPLTVPVKYNVSLGIFAVHIWREYICVCLPVRRLCEMVDDGRHGRQEDATTGPLLRSAAQPTRVCANKANWESATNYNSHTQHRPQAAHLLFSPQAARHICIHASLHPCIPASMHPCIPASLHPCILASAVFASVCLWWEWRHLLTGLRGWWRWCSPTVCLRVLDEPLYGVLARPCRRRNICFGLLARSCLIYRISAVNNNWPFLSVRRCNCRRPGEIDWRQTMTRNIHRPWPRSVTRSMISFAVYLPVVVLSPAPSHTIHILKFQQKTIYRLQNEHAEEKPAATVPFTRTRWWKSKNSDGWGMSPFSTCAGGHRQRHRHQVARTGGKRHRLLARFFGQCSHLSSVLIPLDGIPTHVLGYSQRSVQFEPI